LKISHRGPDSKNVIILDKVNAMLNFDRLAINGLSLDGNQPFSRIFNDSEYYLMCNGEIYNSDTINDRNIIKSVSQSDCECILNDLIINDMDININEYNSEHAFIAMKINPDNTYKVVVSTDRFGKRPLFKGTCDKGIFFSSEVQGIPEYDDIIVERVKPRFTYTIERDLGGVFIQNEREDFNFRSIKKTSDSRQNILKNIRKLFRESVIKRTNSDRKIGVFLSGGLDSLLVTYELVQYYKSLGYEVYSFSTGMPGSDDEKWAKEAAEEFGTIHQHFVLTKEEYFRLLPIVVECIGSYCRTTVRASVGQYFVSKMVSVHTDIIVLLSGDGSDELFFSYDDAFDCPSEKEFERKTIQLLEDIHTSDGLRADRCTSHFGLEIRFPYLDNDFTDYVLSVPSEYRMPVCQISKPLLREAYVDLIPLKFLYRPKVTFSDGVGSKDDQIHVLIHNYFSTYYTDEEFIELSEKYSYHCKPTTNEGLYYREIFTKEFGSNESIARTIPFEWSPEFKKSIDPSAWACASA